MDSTRDLRDDPTEDKWYLELHRIFEGERDSDIQKIGGVHEYVDRLLIESDSPALARGAFGNALERAVLSWQPERDSSYHSRTMLQLVTGYLPTAGFVKILGYMTQWGSFPMEPAEIAAGRPDLHSMALLALQRYYPAPPPRFKQDLGFECYAGLLWRELEECRCEAHVVRRLVQLRLLDIGDARMKELLRREGVVGEFVRHSLSSGNRSQNSISQIYVYCLADDVCYEEFRVGLKALGATLLHLDEGAAVQTRSGEQIILNIPWEALQNYMQRRSRESEDGGRKVVKEIAAAAGGKGWWE